MSERAIVLGAGVNELVAAHLLARSGREAIVLDEGNSNEPEPGWVAPQILRALDLEGKVSVDAADPWAVAALPDGGRLELYRDVEKTAQSIRRVSPADAQKWPAFCERMARLARFLERIYLERPGSPLDPGFALRVRRLGRQGMEDLMRVLPMPVAELLDAWFENDALKGVLGAAGVMGLQQGPRSGGTAFRMVHHSVGNPPGVFRPPRSSLREVLRNLDIRPVKAKQILVREGRAMGVLLESGEELAASSIVSGASPRRTLTELVDPAWLDPELVRAVRNIRARGVVARVTLTLERAPDFFVLTIAPSLDYLERAYDDSKYGRVSSQPWLEARCEGRRVEIDVQYVPRAEAKLAELAANELSRHVPGMTVMESSVTLAADGLAELSLDQAFWGRPTAALAHYRTPIQGLWLCGPDMHPGPGIAGAAGYNCVREMLRG